MNETEIVAVFTTEPIRKVWTVNTSRGTDDFREAIFAELRSGEKLVIKTAANSFTTADTIQMWQRCAAEYRKQGYYCPQILEALDGTFPNVHYQGHQCIAYAEEYSRYESASQCRNAKPFREDLYRMTAKIAAQRYTYTDIPSGYCLFEAFPGEEMDEVTENALAFRDYCQTLPELFQEQTERMLHRWEENREVLRSVYSDLPFSVFQADFNDTNVLVDAEGSFVGIYDFNLAGRDEILNYLFREIYKGTLDEELQEIRKALRVVSEVYAFSEKEIKAAPLIYRCVKPLWYTRVETLKEIGDDYAKVRVCLDEMEEAQTKDIDFRSAMTG